MPSRGSGANDEHGHGSHVAGLAVGNQTGVAKRAKVIAVKVMNGNGGGYFSDVVRGLEFVLERKLNSPGTAMTVFMSLGGRSTMQSMEVAINNLLDAGIVSVVAAGNANIDACQFCPA